MPTLLVPIDFSECTNGLLEQASDYAWRLGLDLTLLHVAQAPAGTQQAVLNGRTGSEMLVEESDRLLRHFAQAVSVTVHTLTRIGPAGDTILAVAEELQPELILVGTHGRRGIARMCLGSVSEHVIRRAKVPVMTLRTQHRPECAAKSCAVCSSHHTEVDERLRAEQEG